MKESEMIIISDKIISGEITDFKEIKKVINDFKADFSFKQARKILSHLLSKNKSDTSGNITWFKQQLAFCTYKDHEIHPLKGFKEALEILEELGLRNSSCYDPETLALGGAVYKRKWEYGGQVENLYEALSFYRAAFERNPEKDLGYGGVNAAFILMILSSRARAAAFRTNTKAIEARCYEDEAIKLWKKIIELPSTLPENDPSIKPNKWFSVTIAEAYFGLKKYEEAGKWLERSKFLKSHEWELQTTFRQFVSLARLQEIELPGENDPPNKWHKAWQTLAILMGEETDRALTCYRGKVGLALSGGGFRAALYHIGVMARLADMDVLRSVEALSTVSGGSIIGAYYYLEVKKLLESKKDAEITRDDYVNIIREIQRKFLKGVQENIRTKTLSSLRKNLKMMFSKRFSRSHRLGELYEEVLFAAVNDSHPKDKARCLKDLLIQPKDEEAGFKPKFSNWRRRSKVPILVLNATSLNTGHNWQFTARSMGEPPGLLGSEIDKNKRFRRLWYDQAPSEELESYRLGYAVAASSCVPALFEPLALDGLYKDEIIRLVDGGVHDNQGVEGLLDESCSYILASDACGQMNDIDNPSDGMLSVLSRTNSILMDRVREAEYQDLRGREDSRALQGLFFVHLKKDLKVIPQDWINCQDPTVGADKEEQQTTPYGISPDIQKAISELRTDLDAFSDVEAYALMCSGYLMTEQQFQVLQERHTNSGDPGNWGGFNVNAPRQKWDFLQIEPLLCMRNNNNPGRTDLLKQLNVGSSLLLKIWRLDNRLRYIGWTVAAILSVIFTGCILLAWNEPLLSPSITYGKLLASLISALVVSFFPVIKLLQPQKAFRSYVLKYTLPIFGFIVSNIHLLFFNGMFLRRGKLRRLLNLKEITP